MQELRNSGCSSFLYWPLIHPTPISVQLSNSNHVDHLDQLESRCFSDKPSRYQQHFNCSCRVSYVSNGFFSLERLDKRYFFHGPYAAKPLSAVIKNCNGLIFLHEIRIACSTGSRDQEIQKKCVVWMLRPLRQRIACKYSRQAVAPVGAGVNVCLLVLGKTLPATESCVTYVESFLPFVPNSWSCVWWVYWCMCQSETPMSWT